MSDSGLGATGRFPLGKARPDDEGELTLAMYDRGGKVFIDFGTHVTWIGLDSKTARQMAARLSELADRADKGHGS